VTKEHSLACGSPDPDPDLEDVMQAWTRFLDLNNLADPANVACLGSFPGAPGYAEWLMSFNFNFNVNANDRRWQSFGFSSSFSPIGIEFAHVLIPQSWLDENEENRKTILENAVNRATPY